jgi:SAM-dependent methyltransferase
MDRRPGQAAERLKETATLLRLFRREQQDPAPFYAVLARRAADELDRSYGPLDEQTIIDLGCGPGFYTGALRERGADVIPVDIDEAELTYAGPAPPAAVIADAADLPLEDASVDGVFCSNMLEHAPSPERVIAEIERVLRPGGWAYVSWTNWFSPWGGHEISPYHYLGPRLGAKLHDRLHGPPRKNKVGEGLFPTHIGRMLRVVRARPALVLEHVEPRYYPRLHLVTRIPVVRELATWNCVLRLRKSA